MSDKPQRLSPVRHLFIDTHKLTTAQRETLVKRLEYLLDLRYYTEVDRPGDGTATVIVHWELEKHEHVDALVWRLIEKVYKPRLQLDKAIGQLRTLHDVLPSPDVRQEIAHREEEERRLGCQFVSPPTNNAMDVYPLYPDGLTGDDFNPETGEPPLMEADDLNRQVAVYYPSHQNEAKAFFHSLDELLRRYARMFMAETGQRWKRLSCSGDAACTATRDFHHIIKRILCPSRRGR